MSRLGWLPFLFLECQEPKSADYMPPSLVAKTLRCRGGWWLCCRKEPLHKEREAARLQFGAGGCFVVGVRLFLVPKPGPATSMARGLRRPTPHTPPALRASYLLKEACFQATPNPRPAMSAQGYLDACLGPATHRLYLGCWRGARGGSAQLPCFCVGGRAFCVSSPQTRQANSELRQKRSRPQSTLQPASSGVFLILLAARYLAQLMWAAAEAAAAWAWVLQPLGGSKGEKKRQPSLDISPSRDEQQEQRFWGTVDTVAAHLQGPPLRRNAPAGDSAAAVHRRPRDEATQMPRSPPSTT